MSKTALVAEKKTTDQEGPEDRIDDFAIDMFKAYGFEGRLPDELVSLYKEVKLLKDMVKKGHLSIEGFAFVVLLFRRL